MCVCVYICVYIHIYIEYMLLFVCLFVLFLHPLRYNVTLTTSLKQCYSYGLAILTQAAKH